MNDVKNVKFIDTFVLLFNGQQPKFTAGIKSMLRLFENMFGNMFWKNLILGVSKWEYSEEKIAERLRFLGLGYNYNLEPEHKAEDAWLSNWDRLLKDKFDVPEEVRKLSLIYKYP